MIFTAYQATIGTEGDYLALPGATIGGEPLKAEGEPLVNPLRLDNDGRRRLLERIESREVMALRAVVRMFADKPNKNRSRPEPGRLQELAEGAAGADYVRNHSRAVEDVAGAILAAEVRTFEDTDALIGLHRITEPSEMAAFVRGERTKFSVAIGAERWECSECSERGLMSPFGTLFACDHYSTEGAELFGRGRLTFLHNAAVQSPAVEGTRVLDLADIRSGAAWTAARERGLTPLNAQPEADDPGGRKKIIIYNHGFNVTPEEVARAAASGSRRSDALRGAGKSSSTEGAYHAPDTRGDTMPNTPTVEELQAQLEAERQRIASLEAEKATEAQAYADRLAASEKARLDTLLDSAVASFCIQPSERAHFHALREAGQMELAETMIKARQPMAATPTNPQGIDQSMTATGGQVDSEEATQWSASEAIVAQHILPKHVLDKLKEGGNIIHPGILPKRSGL